MGMKREILIAVAGLTPQVITETLYYLIRIKKPPSSISEVYVITTSDGKREIQTRLLDRDKGIFFKFCRDHKIDPSSIRFDESSIILLRDSDGTPLRDIRTARDNELVSDQITGFIREKTEDPDTLLHCSVAGGRKTMSVYLAYALMLFGRPGDTLSHVLVDETSEKDRGFFYPKRGKRGKTRIDLAEIPYVRLRDRIKNLFGSEKTPFSQMVKAAQREIDSTPFPEPLEVDLKERCLRIGEREISLSPKRIALYAYFAEMKRTLPDDAGFKQLKGANAISPEEIKRYIEKTHPNADFGKYKFTPESIRQDISKINREIEGALGDPTLSSYYKITTAEPGRRRYGATRYGIRLEGSKIKPPVLP